MEEKIDEFEEEEENLEEEDNKKVAVTKGKNKKPVQETEEPTERYMPFYQTERIGIVDTLTNEFVVEGLPNVAVASLEALKLNKLDKIGIAAGAS